MPCFFLTAVHYDVGVPGPLPAVGYWNKDAGACSQHCSQGRQLHIHFPSRSGKQNKPHFCRAMMTIISLPMHHAVLWIQYQIGLCLPDNVESEVEEAKVPVYLSRKNCWTKHVPNF
jgi:hypothetical protein